MSASRSTRQAGSAASFAVHGRGLTSSACEREEAPRCGRRGTFVSAMLAEYRHVGILLGRPRGLTVDGRVALFQRIGKDVAPVPSATK